MANKKVYFNIRPASRERMWDTPRHANSLCDVQLPSSVRQQSSIKTYGSSASMLAKAKYQISKFLINRQSVDGNIAEASDLLYMWGAFPKNSRKPFIVELDNPYALAYYHINNFNRNKEKIKNELQKAYKITYMSETCKNHCMELYGKELEDKSYVNYPYMENNYEKNNRATDGTINFIFVGLDNRRKGGDELLEAFVNTGDDRIRLTFISNISEAERQKYQADARVTILPPQSREKLIEEIYPKMDIMILPSFHESFGVVLLEALSFGMGIITLNTYATPEIVKNNYNGKLLHHPILKPEMLHDQLAINCVHLTMSSFNNRYLKHNEFYYGMYKEIQSAMYDAVENYRQWQENSLKLFNDKFSPSVWLNNFKNILE